MVIFTVQDKFQINGDLRVSIQLLDNVRTPIPLDEFKDVVCNYRKSGSFYVNVECEVCQQTGATVTTTVSLYPSFSTFVFVEIDNNIHFHYYFQKMYTEYLINNGCGYILNESERNGILDELHRKRLINVSTQFMVSIYGESPTKKEKCMVATVIAELFPSLPVVRANAFN